MSPTPKNPKRPDNAPLPKPNVEFASADDLGEMTPKKVRGMIANPVYAGVGPYPAICSPRIKSCSFAKNTEKRKNEPDVL